MGCGGFLQVLYSRTMLLFIVIYTELQACSDPLIHYNVPTFLFALHTVNSLMFYVPYGNLFLNPSLNYICVFEYLNT